MNTYMAARVAALPGVSMTANLHCSALTVRIRNEVIRSLERGWMQGGYQAKAANLAEQLCEYHDIPYVRFKPNYGQVSGNGVALTPALRTAIIEAATASKAIQRMASGRHYYMHDDVMTRPDGTWWCCLHPDVVHNLDAPLLESYKQHEGRERALDLIERIKAGETLVLADG